MAFRAGQFLARSTPRPVAYCIGVTTSWFYHRFDHPARRAVESNIRRIHAFCGRTVSDEQVRQQVRDVYRNFGKYLVDFFSLFHLTDDERRKLIDMRGVDNCIAEGLRRGKGVITVTAHLGNWELAGASVAMSGFKVSAVALVQTDPKLNELFQSQRLARGVKVIPMGMAGRRCLVALKRNEVVAVLGDRDFTNARVTVDFFGAPARVPQGPGRLAHATGATVVVGVMIRNPDDTYQVEYVDPIVPEGMSVEEVTDRIVRGIEQLIGRFPSQWLLFTDFWDIEQSRAEAHAAIAAAVHNVDYESAPTHTPSR